MLFGRAAFLLLFSLCGLEPVHDGGLFAGFGGFGIKGLVFLRTVVDDPVNHAVVILHRHLCRLEVVFLLKCRHPAFLADTKHSALCRMIGNLFGIYAHALGVIGIETVNLAAHLQSLLCRLLTGGKNASPCVAVVLHILHRDRGIGHFRHFLDLKVEKAERVIVKAVVDIIENELAALIDDDASRFIAVGVMLHQIKAVTADFVLVNGVPRPDVTGNRQTGGVGIHLKVLLLGSFLLLLLLRDHGNRHNLIAQLDKLLRHFEVVRELLHLLYGQRAEAVIRQADYHECSGNNVVDVTVLITQSAVQR